MKLLIFINTYEQKDVHTQKLWKVWKFIFEHFTQRGKLIKAVVWIIKSLEIEEKSANVEIYSRLLFTLDHKNEATKLIDRTLGFANQQKVESITSIF